MPWIWVTIPLIKHWQHSSSIISCLYDSRLVFIAVIFSKWWNLHIFRGISTNYSKILILLKNQNSWELMLKAFVWSVEFKWHGELTIQAQLPITTAAVLHQWVGREQKNPDWFRSFLLPTTYMASFIDPMPNLLWFFSPPKTDLDYRQWKNTHLS